jgi:hypothetical protein
MRDHVGGVPDALRRHDARSISGADDECGVVSVGLDEPGPVWEAGIAGVDRLRAAGRRFRAGRRAARSDQEDGHG